MGKGLFSKFHWITGASFRDETLQTCYESDWKCESRTSLSTCVHICLRYLLSGKTPAFLILIPFGCCVQLFTLFIPFQCKVLTAGLHYSRKSLETQLDHVVQAFQFYHLSPENIEQRARLRIGPDLAAEETERGIISPLRQATISEYQDAGMLLVPMVQSFHNGLAKNFHPLQYSKLLGSFPAMGSIVRQYNHVYIQVRETILTIF